MGELKVGDGAAVPFGDVGLGRAVVGVGRVALGYGGGSVGGVVCDHRRGDERCCWIGFVVVIGGLWVMTLARHR